MDTITFLTTIRTFLTLVETAAPARLAIVAVPVALAPVEAAAPARLAIVAAPVALAPVEAAAPVIKIGKL
jgi:hypothetical protein